MMKMINLNQSIFPLWEVTKIEMCMWPTYAPGRRKVKIFKNLTVLHFDHNHFPGSVKCEKHLDELIVQIWLLYQHPKL